MVDLKFDIEVAVELQVVCLFSSRAKRCLSHFSLSAHPALFVFTHVQLLLKYNRLHMDKCPVEALRSMMMPHTCHLRAI